MKSIFILDSFPALGTLFWIEVFEDLPDEKISEISEMIIKEILEFENLYSRFKPDSLVSKLNTKGNLANPPLELLTMLSYSMEINQLTGGVFNVCLGDILENLGYDGELSFKEKFTLATPKNYSMDNIISLSEGNLYLKEGFKIDLGGIGKGFLIDKITKILLEKFQLKYFLVNGGGDIFVTSDNENPVEIFLENPLNTDLIIGSVKLKNQALGASSPFKRVWFGDKTNTEYSHIVDLKNINKFNSSFVVGKNATICDTLATCLCIDENCILGFNEVSYLVLDRVGEVIKNTLE